MARSGKVCFSGLICILSCKSSQWRWVETSFSLVCPWTSSRGGVYLLTSRRIYCEVIWCFWSVWPWDSLFVVCSRLLRWILVLCWSLCFFWIGSLNFPSWSFCHFWPKIGFVQADSWSYWPWSLNSVILGWCSWS